MSRTEEPTEGDRSRDEADVLWDVADPHHSGRDQGILFESEDSGMTLRLSTKGFQRRVDADQLVPVDREEDNR